MASTITKDLITALRVPQSINAFAGVPLIDVEALDPTEQFTASTAALPAAGTYCAPAIPLASNVANGVFVFLWNDGWKHAQLFPQIQHATAADGCQMEFALWTLKRRRFAAGAFAGQGETLYGLRGVYRGVTLCTAGTCLLPSTDPVAELLTGQVAFCDTIVHDGGGQFADGPIIIGGQGNNARSGMQFDAENSIGVVVVPRCISADIKAGFELCGM